MGVRTVLLGAALLAVTGCWTGNPQLDAVVETGAWAAWHALLW